MDNNGTKIYIILSQTNTIISRLIRLFSSEEYAHSSLSTDKYLRNMYSFGRKGIWNQFNAGFIKEHPSDGVFGFHRNEATCRVLEIEVGEYKHEVLRSELKKFSEADSVVHYRYNFLGIVSAAFNLPMLRSRHFFCSQFVACMLSRSGIAAFPMAEELVRPHVFNSITGVKVIYEGMLRDYLPQIRKEDGLPEPLITEQKNIPIGKMLANVLSYKII